MDIHVPVIETDGGPWVEHDMACPVCWEGHAILDLNTNIFQPCDSCRRKGYLVIKRRLRNKKR